jgi:glycerophosphoryl diester phosphodiesterase
MVSCAKGTTGIPRTDIQVIAHRGASAAAPENTLAAFQRAIDLGAHWFELDCGLTADGEVVAIHDDTVDRTTSGSGHVDTMGLAELKELDAGSWFDPSYAAESVPTLGEALDCASGRIGVYIEIKNSDDDGALSADLFALAHDRNAPLFELQQETLRRIEKSNSANLTLTRKVIAEVYQRDMKKNVVIQSFSPIVCATTLFEAPNIRTELLAQPGHGNGPQWAWFMHWLELLDPPGFNPHRRDATSNLIESIHQLGKTLAVWTVNSRSEMKRLARLGVDAIITDHPDMCLEVMEELK